MADGGPPGAMPAADGLRLPRARGALGLTAQLRDGESRLRLLRQEGCLKLRFPRMPRGAALEAVMVNISGGVAAGDALDLDFDCDPGARLCVTSQAAERVYRARAGDGPARIAARARVAAGARLDWLPQETILFDQARLHRSLEVELAADAILLAAESLVFGRARSGETLRRLHLRDRLRIVREGCPLHDQVLLWDDARPLPVRAALTDGHLLSAAIVLVSTAAGSMLQAVRERLAAIDPGLVSAAASSWNGMLVVRILSRDDLRHRALLAELIGLLRDGPVPRVWQT